MTSPYNPTSSTPGEHNFYPTSGPRVGKAPGDFWYSIGSQLKMILAERLYVEAGYGSFSDYCAHGLSYSRQHCYKLIKMVEFINHNWKMATSPAALNRVERLFALGFTKLYILHSLPEETLDRLLADGLTDQRIALEVATIEQLKREILHQSGRDSPKSE